MDAVQIAGDIYLALKSKLSKVIPNELSYKGPSPFSKKGTDIIRLCILPREGRTIFDSSWCFYEVGVERFSGKISVGFVCYPENKKCGKGRYTGEINELISRYASYHKDFTASQRGTPDQCVFASYSAILPIEGPLEAITKLIVETLPRLEKFSVTK